METALLTGLPLWAINLFLAGVVYCRQPRHLPNQAFAVFVLTVVAWAFSVQILSVESLFAAPLWWKRLPFAAASLIGTSFAVFCETFPDLKSLRSRRISHAFIALGGLVAMLSLSPLVVHDASLSGAGDIRPHYGPLYPVFGIFMIAAFGYGFWNLANKWRTSRGRGRLQIQYLWLGLCWAIAGGTTTNLLVPALTGNSRFGLYGPYFSLFVVGLTAHAIIRHRLMDIRVIIRQSVTYVLAAGVAVGIIWGLLVLVHAAFGSQVTLASPTLPLLISLAGAVAFHPVRVLIQRLFDRYCYRPAYDYRQAIKTISQVLAGLLRLNPLCEHLTTFLLTTLQVEEVVVYLCHHDALLEPRSSQHASPEEGKRAEGLLLTAPNLINVLARAGHPVLEEELTLWIDDSKVEALYEEFTHLHSRVIIPLLIEQRVAGLIAIGEKLSGDPFFAHDLELLSTVGHQAGVALKRAQLHEEVTWMKEYNENILRYMESGLVVVNHDRVITVVNEAAARMLGLAAADLIDQPVDALLPSGLGLPLLDTLTEKTVYTHHEAALLSTSGQTLPIVLSTSMLHGEDGQPAGAILAMNDVSQIKAFEEEKRRIERLASIGAFMSGIAHEIKNPLVAIKTLAELLPEQYDDAEFRDTFTKVTLSEVDRIDSLVRRLRSLSSGAAVPLQPLTPILPLEETLTLVSGELMRRNIRVIRDYPDSLPPVMGDHDQLKQVFVNLCLNSAEAMREGGTLTVTVQCRRPQTAGSAQVIMQIADTGPGIPEEHLSHIFDPFFTLKDEGTGLGLAICRGILDHHRGSITAANGPNGCGAVFTLKLPVAQGVEVYESTAACRD
jgi:PAS domain S-box-containing protein